MILIGVLINLILKVYTFDQIDPNLINLFGKICVNGKYWAEFVEPFRIKGKMIKYENIEW